MKTYIFPGRSENNKEWISTTVNELTPFLNVKGIYWQHWVNNQSNDSWKEEEADKIISDIKHKKVNIIAKSAGTAVCTTILKLQPNLINKIILCGIPIDDFNSEDGKKYYEVLKDFPSENILCIQNENDNHGNYAKVEKFIHDINPNIKIISKPRDDHHYPYSEDFVNFFK